MTIAAQLSYVLACLGDWSRTNTSPVAVANDAEHLWRLLSTKPGAARAILLFDSEEKRGTYEETGRVDRKYLLILSRGRGFAADPSDNLLGNSAGGPALYDLLESARDALRGIQADPLLETNEPWLNYTRTGRMDLGDLRADAYQLEFTLAAQLRGVQPGDTTNE